MTSTPPIARSKPFASPEREATFLRAYDTVLAKWPVRVETLDVASTYGVTRVLASGPPDAPPLVLLPSGGATATVWFANVATLAETHRVYAVDLLGDSGRSIHNGQPVRTVDDVMSWLDGVFDHCGLTSAALAGHSYGGWIALSYALRRPARVSRLALLDPTGCFSAMSPGYLVRGVPVMVGHSGAAMLRLLRWETGGTQLDPDWVELVRLGTQDFPKSKVVLPRRPPPDELRALATPTLVLLAENSRTHDIARAGATARRLVPGGGVEVLPGATHHTLPHHEPAELNRRLTNFLSTSDS